MKNKKEEKKDIKEKKYNILEKESLKEAIKKIKEKKELKDLNDKFIEEKIKEFLKKEKKIRERIKKEHFLKSKEFETLKKNIRKELRKIYGLFKINNEEYDDYEKDILLFHKSTKERKAFYSLMYRELIKYIKPKIIIDLGAGFNVGSINLLKKMIKKEITYYPIELSKKDIVLIKNYMNNNNIKGEALNIDIIKEEEKIIGLIKKIKPDIVFMLKLIDTLEEQKRHFTKKLIPEIIKYSSLLVSFSKKSISSKKELPKRRWFENYLKKNNMKYYYFEIPNEYFFLIQNCIKKKI